MDITKELGLRIRYYRKEKQITQEKLAEICGLHPTYIGQLERGEKNATVESIYRVAKGLDLPMSRLVENVEYLGNDSDSIPLEIYQQLMALPYDKQDKLRKILLGIIDIVQNG